MSGNGGDNAHDNAFGGGKNPGIGNSGSGNHSGNGNSGNSGSGANVGHGGSMTVDLGNGITATFDGVHSLSPGEGSSVPWGGGSGHGNNGGHGNGGGNGNQGNGATIYPDPGKPGSYISSDPGKTMLASSIDDNSANGTNSYTLHTGKNQTIKVTVPNGDIEQMNVEYNNWKGPKLSYKNMKKFISGFMEYRKAEDEHNSVKDAISKVNDFYKELTSKYGDKLTKEAQALADDARGKKIRSAKEAIDAFDKYKDVLDKKFSVADREAIAKALESLNKEQMAKQLKTFGKAFGIVGEIIQWGDFTNGLVKGFRTNDWNDAIMSGEKIAAGKVASIMVAVAFSAMAVNPVGILGFAVIMAVTSALITDERLKQLNDFIKDLK